jgi:hypothetical protein
MALPPSGTITLLNLQTEFGGTNPIGLNEYYRGGGLVPNVPANANVPTSGAISLSNFYGATAVTGFTATLTGGGITYANNASPANDSIGDTTIYGGSGTVNYLVKYSSGSLSFQKSLTWGSTVYMLGTAFDSSDSFYISGTYGGSQPFYCKFDSSYNFVYGIRLGVTGALYSCETVGNYLYVVGSVGGSSSSDIFISKVNATSATVAWTYTFDGGLGRADVGRGIAVGSTGNIYICGDVKTQNTPGQYYTHPIIIKLDTTGAIQWQKMINFSSTSLYQGGYGVALDSSENVYATMKAGSAASNTYITLIKFDTNGNSIWQRDLSTPLPVNGLQTSQVKSIVCDKTNNYIYVCTAYGAGGFGSYSEIFKFDLSGNLVWVRRVVVNNFGSETLGLSLDPSGDYLTYMWNDNSNFPTGSGVLHIPTTGSGTGSYVVGTNTVIYSVSTSAVLSASYTLSAGPLSATLQSYTSVSLTPTIASGTAVSAITSI